MVNSLLKVFSRLSDTKKRMVRKTDETFKESRSGNRVDR